MSQPFSNRPLNTSPTGSNPWAIVPRTTSFIHALHSLEPNVRFALPDVNRNGDRWWEWLKYRSAWSRRRWGRTWRWPEGERQLASGGRRELEVVDLARIKDQCRRAHGCLRWRQVAAILRDRAPLDGCVTCVDRHERRSVTGKVEEPKSISRSSFEGHRVGLLLSVHEVFRVRSEDDVLSTPGSAEE